MADEITGILEIVGGAGFLRRRDASYLPSSSDVYVPQRLIQQTSLRTGDEVTGEVGVATGKGKSPPLTRVSLVNGQPAGSLRHRVEFQRLPAVHPTERLSLECGMQRRGQPDPTNRIIDLFCPIGKGQRAMIVAPAKAGKTTILQAIAEGVVRNYPEALVIMLLVDERPEEITDMEMCGFGEVVASSFDFPPDRHTAVAEMTLERARRQVELGRDVVIILDSITRLARAYNTVEAGTGRTLTGGLDANALEKPKRFLGSARNIDPAQGGGSLTIIATALIDTGSRMDQVIFEEFKGTGNSELVLSRELADRRLFPAIDLNASSTRREELLLSPDELTVSHALRRRFGGSDPASSMSELTTIFKRFESNAQLVSAMKGEVGTRA